MRISYDEAVKTGIDACVKELGQDVIERYNGVMAQHAMHMAGLMRVSLTVR